MTASSWEPEEAECPVRAGGVTATSAAPSSQRAPVAVVVVRPNSAMPVVMRMTNIRAMPPDTEPA